MSGHDIGIRAYYQHLNSPPWDAAWRFHLLRLTGDLDRVVKAARSGGPYPGKVYDAPQGGVREVPRPCSHCRGLTVFTTPRGRSVHPTCEGWLDTLSSAAMEALEDQIMSVLPIVGIEESLSPYDPAETLANLTEDPAPGP